jgi:hypothetical protein
MMFTCRCNAGYFFFMKGGVYKRDLWPPSVGNSWRTTTDIRDNWTKMIRNIDQVEVYDLSCLDICFSS